MPHRSLSGFVREQFYLPQKIPLYLIVVVPFVVQISAAVGLIGWLSLRNGQKAVNELAAQLQSETTARIEQRLTTYLETPQLINQLNADAVRRGQFETQSFQTQRYLWQQFQRFDAVSWIYYAAEQNGEFIGVTRRGRDRTVQIALNQQSKNYQTDFYAFNPQGTAAARLETDSAPYRAKTRPWYRAAVASGRSTWSKIYADFDTAQLVITNSLPVYDDSGTIAGVVGVDLFLNDISQFLSTLNVGESGQTFIVERSGFLVASSTLEQPVRAANREPKRISALKSQNPLIQEAVQYVIQHLGSLNEIDTQQQLSFVLNQTTGSTETRYFLRATAFQDGHGLNWLIFVVVPEADFMEQIHANTHTTIALCLGALGLAIALGLLTSSWITQPILRLSAASKTLAEQAASANFASIEVEPELEVAGANELSVLAQSFNQMAHELRISFIALAETNDELELRVEQLKQTQLQLVQSEKMSALGQLIAGVAHEINNPVNFINGNLKYAQQYTQDILHLLTLYQQDYPQPSAAIATQTEAIDLPYLVEDLPKLLTSMAEGSHRISEMSKSLRTFSRADQATKVAADLHEGIDSTLMMLKHRLKATPLRPAIEVLKAYGALPLVECYPGQLNQVFMNILSNAIDALDEAAEQKPWAIGKEQTFTSAIPRPKPTILIRTSHRANQAVVQIIDNGTGMAESVRAQVFDYLFTTKPAGKGTGLGLPISHQIVVEKHQGTLTVHSALGQGTEFRIEMPIALSN